MRYKDLLRIIDELDITDNSRGGFEVKAETVDGHSLGSRFTNTTDGVENFAHSVIQDYKEANFSLKIN